MMKIAFAVAVAAAVLMSASLLVGTIPAEAQNLKMAQGVDVQIGRDRDDRYDRDRRRRYYSDTTVGVGPRGVTVGPRQRCRMVTTTVERDDGRRITRDRDRRRNDSDATVGIGPGGVTIGPRQNCRMVTTTVERPDGRTITRKERRCD